MGGDVCVCMCVCGGEGEQVHHGSHHLLNGMEGLGLPKEVSGGRHTALLSQETSCFGSHMCDVVSIVSYRPPAPCLLFPQGVAPLHRLDGQRAGHQCLIQAHPQEGLRRRDCRRDRRGAD